MEFEIFASKFSQLNLEQQLSIYNDCFPDESIRPFDEEFFNVFFNNPMEASRATFFGQINNWLDPYIGFNGYGNLVSYNETEVENKIQHAIEDIFDNPYCWEDEIK